MQELIVCISCAVKYRILAFFDTSYFFIKWKIKYNEQMLWKDPIFPAILQLLKANIFCFWKKMSENNFYCLMISCLLFPVLQLLKPVLFLTFWYTNFSWVFWHVSEHVCHILSMCITWIQITALRLMDLLASLHFDTDKIAATLASTRSSIFDLYI